MDSDRSYSADSSVGSSSGSIDGEERVELIKVLGQTLELPQDLCEDYGIFKEVLTIKTWESLSEENKEHLKTFLPMFGSNDVKEKEITLNMLFNKEPFHFTSPLNAFHDQMRQGNFRPEIVDMMDALKETQDEYRFYKVNSYYSQLMPDMILSRERILAAARAAPPGNPPHIPPMPVEYPESERYLPPHKRAKTRFFQELSAIRAEVGGETSDEDEDELQITGKKKRICTIPALTSNDGVSSTMGGGPESVHKMDSLKKIIAAHRKRRFTGDDSSELDTSGITLEGIQQRVGITFDVAAKRPMFGGLKVETIVKRPKHIPQASAVIKKEPPCSSPMPPPKTEPNSVKVEEPFSTSMSLDSNPLLPNIKIKDEHDDDSDLHSLVDPMMSPPSSSNLPYSPDLGDGDFDFSNLIKDEPFDSLRHPLKLEDLDGIDMMNLPIELADDPCDVLSNALNDTPLFEPDESLSETTYANFLCLVRALFPASSAHRASKRELQARCSAAMRSPIAALNTWYHDSEDWCLELDSALDFLAGEWGEHPDDFVPYLQFIPETQIYQWIGAGRDGDAALGRLCERWLSAAAQSEPSFYEPPPPKYPTSWVVRPPTSSETSEFRAQERRRFSAATKPFSYVQHGYRAVVGPCARSASCSAHSSLLAHDRPRQVTFMALVRDAVARLPNGEGTRHDILTMLKTLLDYRMTQYLTAVDDQTLLSAISSTLDRLYTAKRDPVVKYDHRSAVWTYLFRNRTEEDWLKTTVSRNRTRKSSSSPRRKIPPKSTASSPASGTSASTATVASAGSTALAVTATVITSVGSAMNTVSQIHNAPTAITAEKVVDEGSDIDVDVDDVPGPSVQALSSAQLLMQATKSSTNQVVLHLRPNKGKIVVAGTSPPPRKPRAKSKPRTKTAPNRTKRSPPKSVQSPIGSPKSTATVISPPAKPVTTMAKLPTPPTTQAKPTPAPAPAKPVTLSSSSPVTYTIPSAPTKTTSSRPQLQPFIRTPNKRPIGKSDHELDNLTSEELDALAMPAPPPPPPKYPVARDSTRSLLIKAAPELPTIVTASNTVPISSHVTASRRGVFRLLTPAAPTAGKSLIVQNALGLPPAKKRTVEETPAATPARCSPVLSYPQVTITTTTAAAATAATTASSPLHTATRTVQLPGGKTLHLTGPPAPQVQLPSGHTLQLSSLQIPAQSVRLPNGQTVQLTPAQPLRTIPASAVKPKLPTIKLSTPTSQPTIQIPLSSVQIGGQTVQLSGGHSVQLGHGVHLGGQLGHTVKLAANADHSQVSNQLREIIANSRAAAAAAQASQAAQAARASQPEAPAPVNTGHSVPAQSPTMEITPSNTQLKPTMQLTGHTVQLPSGQTLQLGTQTVQLPYGQTLQLSGSAFQLGQALKNAQAQAHAQAQAKATQSAAEKPTQQGPILAKVLTNAQGQVITLESMIGGRTIHLSGLRPQAKVHPQITATSTAPSASVANVPASVANLPAGVANLANVGVGNVRVMTNTGTRMNRPLLLTTKPMHNILLQQGEASMKASASAAPPPPSSQAIVITSIAAPVSTTTTAAPPVIKLHQVTPLQHIKLQGIKIQQQSGAPLSVSASTGVRNMLLEGQQLKLVGGRHVIARFLRPPQPQPPPQPPPQ